MARNTGPIKTRQEGANLAPGTVQMQADRHRMAVDRDVDLRRLGLLLLTVVEMSHEGYVRVVEDRRTSQHSVLVRRASGRQGVPHIGHEAKAGTLTMALDRALVWLRASGETVRGRTPQGGST